ncbi:MAG: hypothetical protein KJ906_01020 [Nanoarchaeota archaeon]|nr:hypothetical protein [Nanoarchaeota archaeon]
MEYEIWIDLVRYKEYTGNIDIDLTKFIFGTGEGADEYNYHPSDKWDDRLTTIGFEHGSNPWAEILAKNYTKEEMKKYEIEEPECSRIGWKFTLDSDDKAKEMANFLIKKSKEFMLTDIEEWSGKPRSKEEKNIPGAIYKIGKDGIEKLKITELED